MWVSLILATCGLLAGFFFGYQKGHADGAAKSKTKNSEQRPSPKQTKRTVHVDVAVQGPTRYTRHTEHPKFVPLPDHAWGSSVVTTWIYETTREPVLRLPDR